MNRQILPAIFCAAAVLCSLPAAHAEVEGKGSSMYCVKGESEKLCLEEVFE